jgi:hypothetical protein
MITIFNRSHYEDVLIVRVKSIVGVIAANRSGGRRRGRHAGAGHAGVGGVFRASRSNKAA